MNVGTAASIMVIVNPITNYHLFMCISFPFPPLNMYLMIFTHVKLPMK